MSFKNDDKLFKTFMNNCEINLLGSFYACDFVGFKVTLPW